MTATEWRERAIKLAFDLASVRESREATRGEVARAQADFTDHFGDGFDHLILETYAEGMAEGRAEMNRRIG